MMKKTFITLLSAAAMLMTACSDDKAAWENLPSGPIAGADAVLTFNGVRSYGRLTLTATDATSGSINLDNVIPGYLSVDMDVKMTEQPDGSFAIAGNRRLTSLPEIMPSSRSQSGNAIYVLTAAGTISPDGKAVVALKSELTPEAKGNVAGTWHLPSLLPVSAEAMSKTPVAVTLKLTGQPEKSAELSAEMSLLTGALLYQTVGDVKFNSDGNLTIIYSPILDFARLLTDGIDCTNGTFKTLNPKNLSTGSNLVFWCYGNNALHLTPYLPNISYKIAVDNGQNPNLNDGATQEKLENAIAELAQIGIDTDRLLALFNQLNVNGIPIIAQATDSTLTLVVTKEMLDPIMELVAPALPKLNAMLKAFLADESNAEIAALITGKVFPALGIESLTDFGMLWDKGIDDLSITINLIK